ncbi:unnamed protein product [Withania somnifera]
MDLIMQLCEAPDCDVHAEFVSRLADRLYSGSLAWSQRQLHTDHQKNHSYCLEETDALIFNLVRGLHLSREDIQGEILFVLYKLFLLNVSQDGDDPPSLSGHFSKLLHSALAVLMKAQSDDVCLNCIAFLTVITQRGFFRTTSIVGTRSRSAYDVDHLMETNEPLAILFAEAVKGPLLSSDNQVQIAAADLLYLYLSGKDVLENEIQVFVEENIADYASVSFLLSIQDASTNCILTCLVDYGKYPGQLLSSLRSIIDVCKTTHILPWFMKSLHEMEDENIPAAILKNFYAILLQDSDTETKIFANVLCTSSWFSFAYGCLGFFPSEKMKKKVYLIFSVMTDNIIGVDSRKCISYAAPHLPSDPIDLLFLLAIKAPKMLNYLLANWQFCCYCTSARFMTIGKRIADDKLVLASLEQYILLNSSENMHGSSVLEMLTYLYALYRGFAKVSYQIPYSTEAERIVFHLLAEKDWNLLSTRIHVTSLKWLFQQEKICNVLSAQILKFCICNYFNKIIVHVMAELVASGDNFLGILMVFLLGEAGEQCSKDDIVSVVNTKKYIIEISTSACVHGIAGAIKNRYCKFGHSLSPDTFMASSELVSCILQAVHSEFLSDEEPWVAILVKIIDYLIPSVAADGWTPGSLISIPILSMGLHHSVNQVMVEASKTIILSTHLLSLVNTTISSACSKGPSLVDQDNSGEALVFVLSLLLFCLRTVHAILPGIKDCHILLDPTNVPQPWPHNSIQCRDLCNGIEDDRSRKSDKLEFRTDYLLSIMAILEGQVSMNCSLYLSMLIGWQDVETEVSATQWNNWCRLEELVTSLTAPSLASKSFMIHHKPAIHIAVALLRRKKVPQWMTSIFDESCIAAFTKNIANSNLSAELVFLLRKLLNCGFLNDEQIAALNRVFQFVISLITTQPSGSRESTRFQSGKRELLEEIDLFSKCLMRKDLHSNTLDRRTNLFLQNVSQLS